LAKSGVGLAHLVEYSHCGKDHEKNTKTPIKKHSLRHSYLQMYPIDSTRTAQVQLRSPPFLQLSLFFPDDLELAGIDVVLQPNQLRALLDPRRGAEYLKVFNDTLLDSVGSSRQYLAQYPTPFNGMREWTSLTSL